MPEQDLQIGRGEAAGDSDQLGGPGQELRRLRDERGISLTRPAADVHYSKAS